MNEALARLDALLDDWIAHPETRPPRLAQPKPEKKTTIVRKYDLPEGTVVGDDGVVTIPGTQEGTHWHVKVADWSCDCPAFKRWPPCKHVRALKELAKAKA
jgi:hypothetical protein